MLIADGSVEETRVFDFFAIDDGMWRSLFDEDG